MIFRTSPLNLSSSIFALIVFVSTIPCSDVLAMQVYPAPPNNTCQYLTHFSTCPPAYAIAELAAIYTDPYPTNSTHNTTTSKPFNITLGQISSDPSNHLSPITALEICQVYSNMTMASGGGLSLFPVSVENIRCRRFTDVFALQRGSDEFGGTEEEDRRVVVSATGVEFGWVVCWQRVVIDG